MFRPPHWPLGTLTGEGPEQALHPAAVRHGTPLAECRVNVDVDHGVQLEVVAGAIRDHSRSSCARWLRSWPARMRTIVPSVSDPRSGWNACRSRSSELRP